MAAPSTSASVSSDDHRRSNRRERDSDSARPRRVESLAELDLGVALDQRPASAATTDAADAAAVYPLEPPVLWGDAQLNAVQQMTPAESGAPAEAEGEGPAAVVVGQVQAPFLHGQVQADVGNCGNATGRHMVDAEVRLAGHPIARLGYQAELVDGLPIFPAIEFDGSMLRMGLPPLALGAIEPTEGAAAATTLADDGTLTVDVGGVSDLPAPLAALFATGDPQSLYGEPTVLPTSLAATIESVTGQVVAGLRLMVNALLAASAAPVESATIDNGLVSIAPGRYDPTSETSVALIARAIAMVLAGEDGPVPATVTDPGQDDAADAGAGAAAAGAAVDPAQAPPLDVTAPPDGVDGTEPTDAGPGNGDAAAPKSEAVAEGDGPAEGQPIELLMPAPPAEPTPEHSSAIGRVRSRSSSARTQTEDVPTAAVSTGEARDAAVVPAAEALGRAQLETATALEQQIEPSPEIVQLCRDMKTAIREHRPVDEDELLDADLQEPAEEAGSSLNESVQDQGEGVSENYGAVDEPLTPETPREPQVPNTPDSSIGSPDLTAPGAAPPEIPSEDLSLDNDQAALTTRVDESGIHTPVTAEIPDGPFAQAREGQAELGALAQSGPTEVHAEQQAAIAASQEQMAALQQQALDAFNASRSTNVSDASARQTDMAETENQTRQRLSNEANATFQLASEQVGNLLSPLTDTAMSMWRADVARLTTEFRDDLDRVKRWVEERHEGIGGAFVAAWDAVTGLPGWVTRAYDTAEQAFADGVCDSLTEISIHVNTVIASVEGIISQAEEDIRRIFTENLPEGLESWAAEQLTGFERQIGELREDVEETRTGFLRDVSREAISAVQTVQAEVEALREEAKGLIGKVADALAEFIDDPVTAIINGLLRLVGIPPTAFWAMLEKIQQAIDDIADDPINFINNLVDAVRQGFEGFFERFPTHVIQGFWDWLFSGLGDQGVSMPEDFSIKSLVGFALELLGLSWPAIREILVRHIGEENVELIEQAWELVSMLIEKGIDGVLEMIQSFLEPANLVAMIIEAAVEYLVTTLIAVVSARIILMLNPVGIIAQAIMLIWDILKWIFTNAARIFRFVETIVNGIADIVAGNIGAMAEAVEVALASLIPVVIDFLAGLLGLDGLPDAVADVIKGMRQIVLEAVDKAIGFLVTRAQQLLEALGLGGDDDNADADDDESNADDTELGTEVRFVAEGESHRHWIDNTGSDAKLMVASTPITVIDKIREWEGRVAGTGQPAATEDQAAQASPLLEQANSLHAEADGEADDLASVYAAAAAGTNDVDGDGDNDAPPSDAAVESVQRRLAGVLDQLFTLFDAEPDLGAIFTDEIAAMHSKVQSAVRADLQALRPGEKHAVQSWADLRPVLERSSGFGRILDRPSHLSSGSFGTEMSALALAAAKSTDPSFTERRLTARKQKLVGNTTSAPWAEMVAVMQARAWGGGDPSAVLESGFETILDTEIDPDVRQAITDRGGGKAGMVKFFQDLSDSLSVGPAADPINAQNFRHRVFDRPANKAYLTALFRPGGLHEWIPTNMIPEVIAATRSPFDMFEWDDWVQMQDEMRTDTSWIIFDPSSPARIGNAQVAGRPDRTALTGHVGAVYYQDAEGGRRASSVHQGPWHDQLRDAFNPDSPPETVRAMRDIAANTVWGGGSTSVEYRGPYVQARSNTWQSIDALGLVAQANRTGLLEQFRAWSLRFSK